MAKINNRQKYPNANHQPRHLADFRRKDAKERQEAYDQLSLQQKLNLLDLRLGEGVGAIKQRARLNALLLKEQGK